MNDEEYFETLDENASIMRCSVCDIIAEVEVRPTGAICKFCLETAQETFGPLGGKDETTKRIHEEGNDRLAEGQSEDGV